MDDLISRSALLEKMSELNGWDEYNEGVGACHRLVDFAPAVDAESVSHGRWIREDETQALLSVMWHCSKCEIPLEMNGIYTPIGAGYKYCPNCGAKMDGKEGA
jgi:hypothetical protein